MTRFMSVAFTNAVEGKEEEYNTWYTERHVHDVLAIPGIVSAQRFRVIGDRASGFDFSFMTLYEIETEDLESVHKAIAERSGTPLMPRSDSVSTKRLFLDAEPIMKKMVRADP
ncbi:DUF4286 family protein [Cupriavidus taiwanensis]|uniref:DUF4286 family protein n=1 Tax=Cupriavidus taiwanensis TaxID=164546 RepID=UPI000E128F35|nr:DUF4286 family protein [Cupriavidus taiwanensis]SOZ29652.1 conserved hypothetical protein [Cupriavidus taiwanensis]SPA34464.1 conserved hypothetical protein [Cupriavidus taiwanensis]